MLSYQRFWKTNENGRYLQMKLIYFSRFCHHCWKKSSNLRLFVSFLRGFFVFFCCFSLLFFLLSIFRFEEVFKTLCRLLVNVLEIKTTKLLFHWEIWYYQLSWNRKLASVENFKAHVSRLAPRQSETIRSDEGLTLETSALQLFTMANLRHQLCW